MEARRKKVPTRSITTYAFTQPTLTTTDPNAPKRGLSAYMFFANEQRENVREENPGISFGMYCLEVITFSDRVQARSVKSSVNVGRP